MKLLSKLSKSAIVSMATLSLLAMPVAYAEDFGGADVGSKDVPVTVEFNEADDTIAAKAMIPTSINIKGKTGKYHVMAYYETSELNELNANLLIVPSSTFTLTKQGASTTTTASVTQTKTTFTPTDVRNGKDAQYSFSSSGNKSENRAVKEASTEGTITADGLSYGTWKGNLTFNISVNK